MKLFSKPKDKNKEILEKELGKIQTNFPLKQISYIRIGGPAQYFFEAKNKKDLISAIKIARKIKMPHLVIGRASNILFQDKGFKGLIIKNNYSRLSNEEAIQVFGKEAIAPSGIQLLVLIKELAQKGLGGIEFLSGIPGTLAGAVIGNSGANALEIKDFVLGVNILDEKGEIKFLPQGDLGFEYRRSIFKGLAFKSHYLNYPIILEVHLKVIPKAPQEIMNLIRSLIGIRQKKIPQEPSLGCVFKNPLYSEFKKEINLGSGIGRGSSRGEVSAGYLIDRAGLKGTRQGKIQISQKHANIFVNLGQGRAKDYLELIKQTKEEIKRKFGIILKEEIEIIEDQELE